LQEKPEMEINKIRMRQFMIGARRTLNTGVIDVLWPVAARRTSPKPGVSKIYSSEPVRAPVMSGFGRYVEFAFM
jgi:hypothetical protein